MPDQLPAPGDEREAAAPWQTALESLLEAHADFVAEDTADPAHASPAKRARYKAEYHAERQKFIALLAHIEADAAVVRQQLTEAHNDLNAVDEDTKALNAACERMHRQLTEAQADRDELSEIIWWMLGERDEFPNPPEFERGKPMRLYWWRRELRARFDAFAIQHYARAARLASSSEPGTPTTTTETPQ